jgi:hypothetical protein
LSIPAGAGLTYPCGVFAYSKCEKFFPNYPENPLFEKSRFSGPFRQNLLSYSEITLLLLRTLPVASGCNKVSENEKTSGNRYISTHGGHGPPYQISLLNAVTVR